MEIFPQVFPPHTQEPKTRDQVAKALDLGSGKQWDKLKDIGKLADAGNAVAKAVLTDLLPGTSHRNITPEHLPGTSREVLVAICYQSGPSVEALRRPYSRQKSLSGILGRLD